MSLLKQWVPAWMKRRRSDAVRHQSTHRNLYHCTVQKSASQWVRGILSDPRTHRYCGLTAHQHQLSGGHDPRKLTERSYIDFFPDLAIVTPLYINYEGFTAIPKRDNYRAFFVMRDPRDVVVSWYFSARHSHRANGGIDRVRQDLLRLSEPEGLLYTVNFLAEFGLFEAQRSWAGADAKDPNVLLLRYEDMIGAGQLAALERLLSHCDIPMPTDELQVLLKSHSFAELSGRERGHEDVHAHYRKGIAGDWRNHFDDAVQVRLMEVAGDVIDLWGYR